MTVRDPGMISLSVPRDGSYAEGPPGHLPGSSGLTLTKKWTCVSFLGATVSESFCPRTAHVACPTAPGHAGPPAWPLKFPRGKLTGFRRATQFGTQSTEFLSGLPGVSCLLRTQAPGVHAVQGQEWEGIVGH